MSAVPISPNDTPSAGLVTNFNRLGGDDSIIQAILRHSTVQRTAELLRADAGAAKNFKVALLHLHCWCTSPGSATLSSIEGILFQQMTFMNGRGHLDIQPARTNK